MDRIKLKFLIKVVIILVFVQTAFADVSHNQDFPLIGLSIQTLLEPADSNVYQN